MSEVRAQEMILQDFRDAEHQPDEGDLPHHHGAKNMEEITIIESWLAASEHQFLLHWL